MENKTKKSPITILKTADKNEAKKAAKFGRVDSDGTVWLIENGKEHKIGEFKVKEPKDALDFYVKRYLNLMDRLSLFETRMKVANLKKSEIDSSLDNFKKELINPAIIGDVEKLRQRLDKIISQAEIIKLEIDKTKAVGIQQAITERIKIINQAEKIVAEINNKVNWKQTSDKFADLLNQWTNNQKNSPKVAKDIDDKLWQKFSENRRVFENAKKEFYATFNKSSQITKHTKEKIITKAKSLSTSEKWNETQEAFRNLIKDWKAAGRTRKNTDDKLWQEFKGYMDQFYDKKNSVDAILEEDYAKNYQAKTAIIQDMKKLLPISDAKKAREKYRAYLSKLSDIGKVPANKIKKIQEEISKIDKAVSQAENEAWQKTDPRKIEINQKLAELKKKLESK
ncbi:MAG: DUF349 domain-containing protein [Bifidobacteriaceae bacterium]|jgi:hypothetical protein|nr:DUF349 domain-containing protein [Bifidobacteriaceae bacterium]